MRKISIVMAVYNGSKFIGKQLDSIFAQDYHGFELIIVDDASNDDSLAIIKQYNDERIVLIENKLNIGCGPSFEKGILCAKGEYIALCDQDDIWMPNKLSVLVNAIDDNILVYSNCTTINENDAQLSDSYRSENKMIGLDSSDLNLWHKSIFNSFVLGCSMLFKKELISEITPIIDLSWNHDKWIFFNAVNIGRVKYVDERLFKYRLHDNNLSYCKAGKKTRCRIVLDFLFSSKKPLSFDVSALKKIRNNDFKIEMLKAIECGKLFFFIKYYKFFNLRKEGYQRFEDNVSWLICLSVKS